MEMNRSVLSRKYDRALHETLGAQVIVGCLAALVLDGGVMARVVVVAMLGFWLSAAILMIRRPFEPAKYDLLFVQRGFWPILAAATLVQLRG